jgi:enolase
MIIKEVISKKIKDSNGKETIEVSVNKCKASSPSGKSTGKYETQSYFVSMDNNIKLINELNELKKVEINRFEDLEKVEEAIRKKFKLKNAKQFGANALFALESAVLKALAKYEKKELWQIINPNAIKMPFPVGNAVGGGLHARKKNAPVFQEFLIIPGRESIEENVKIMNEVYNKIQFMVNSSSKDDEGAWETTLTNDQILEIIFNLKDVRLGVDVAASTFYKNNSYKYYGISLSRDKQIGYINSLIEKYNLLYVEDPLDEEDFEGFSKIIPDRSLRTSVLIVGDDLTTTNLERVKKAVEKKSINAMIIKPNQNGSLLELKEVIDFCKKNGIKTILSHRAGETLDSALADYAFGFQTDYIKCGISTKWREIKLNRLIEIEKSLG